MTTSVYLDCVKVGDRPAVSAVLSATTNMFGDDSAPITCATTISNSGDSYKVLVRFNKTGARFTELQKIKNACPTQIHDISVDYVPGSPSPELLVGDNYQFRICVTVLSHTHSSLARNGINGLKKRKLEEKEEKDHENKDF